MTDAIAIDFGTSRTKAAYLDRSGKPELMRLGHHDQPFVPSLFYLARDSEQILWGFDAEEMLEDDPAGIVEVLKRHLQDRHVYANRRRVSPGELLTLLFSSVRAQAGDELPAFQGTPPRKVYLTVPALYGAAVEKLLRGAAQAAGFAEVVLVPEPVAAAQAWLTETKEAGQAVVVLDCGGGTLDWAYLRYQGGEFHLVPDCPPGGDVHVGGHDVDQELLRHLRDLAEDEEQEIEARQPWYLQKVRLLKERYCRGLPPRPVRIGSRQVNLDEGELQAVLRERFTEQACEGLKHYLERVRRVCPEDQPTVLLVGGSARIKGLKESIEAQCGCRAAWWERSEYATVLGAVPAARAVPPLPSKREQYRTAVEIAWADKKLNATEAKQLATLAKQLGLSEDEAAQIEREVMGERREAILGRVVPGTVFRDTLKDGSQGPEMVVIPAGTFRMGDIQGVGADDEKPVHTVKIARPFAMGKYPVTFAEYDRFARATGRELPDDKNWGRGNRPVIHVSWEDAVAYTEWLSQQTGKPYRLPSEAEWEYAARGGTETAYWWGDDIGHNRANCDGCGSRWDNKQTSPVGSFQPNPFGLYDMLGNVWEWVQDCWNESYHGAPANGSAWLSSDCGLRVIRGGSWYYVPRSLRAASRTWCRPDYRYFHLGFRLAQDL